MVYGIILLLNFAHSDVIMVWCVHVTVRDESAGPWRSLLLCATHHHLHAAFLSVVIEDRLLPLACTFFLMLPQS